MTAPSINDAKFRETTRCRMRHGSHPQPASHGALCDHHAADLRDLLADIAELWAAFLAGDRINQTATKTKGKRPHPPLPIDVNRLAIDDPGEPVPWTWERNGNPKTGRWESNGETPDIRAIVYAAMEAADPEANPRPDIAGSDDLAVQLDWLRANTRALSHTPDYRQHLRDLRACRRALALAIGDQPGPKPIARCPECECELFTDLDEQRRKLRREGRNPDNATGRADLVKCHSCRASWQGRAALARLKYINEQMRAVAS